MEWLEIEKVVLNKRGSQLYFVTFHSQSLLQGKSQPCWGQHSHRRTGWKWQCWKAAEKGILYDSQRGVLKLKCLVLQEINIRQPQEIGSCSQLNELFSEPLEQKKDCEICTAFKWWAQSEGKHKERRCDRGWSACHDYAAFWLNKHIVRQTVRRSIACLWGARSTFQEIFWSVRSV